MILISALTGWTLISAFALLVAVSIGIINSGVGLKDYGKTAAIEKYK